MFHPQSTPPVPVENQGVQQQQAFPRSKRQCPKIRSRSSIEKGLEHLGQDEVQTMWLDIMDSMGLTPGGPCTSCLAGEWCSNTSICAGLINAHLNWCSLLVVILV